jgi:hypothetical protein
MASDGVNTLALADAVCDRGFFRGRVLDQDPFIKPSGFSRGAAVALARRSCDARVGSATTCLLIGDANWNEHSIVRGLVQAPAARAGKMSCGGSPAEEICRRECLLERWQSIPPGKACQTTRS